MYNELCELRDAVIGEEEKDTFVGRRVPYILTDFFLSKPETGTDEFVAGINFGADTQEKSRIYIYT